MEIIYEHILYARLEIRTVWTGSRITETDLLTLDEAAKFASQHTNTEISADDFLRAASRGEIFLKAITHQNAKLKKFDGGIYCNQGTPTENSVPKGSILSLPISACR